MNYSEAFSTAWLNLAGHKLRAALSMLGIVFGVGAVISMLSIGAGAEREAMSMIERLGVNNVLVRARDYDEEELREVRERSAGLAPRDKAAIEDAVPGVARVAARIEFDPWRVASQRSRAELTTVAVEGVDTAYGDLVGLAVSSGRFIEQEDELTFAQAAVIGAGVKDEFFGEESALGQLIKIDELWLEVIGVLERVGEEGEFQGVSLGSADRVIYLPASTLLRKLNRDPLESPFTELVVELGDTEADLAPGSRLTQETADAIDKLLDQLHGGASDWEIVVPELLLQQSRQTQRLFNLVMGAIAGISLLVGGIGIMNIMLASVLERTREIGLRRAIGAKQRDVVLQFLVESFTIGALGGLAGVLFGVLVARIIAAFAGWPTLVTPSSVILSTSVSILVGMIAGMYPAVRASRLDPIESLRWE